VILFHFNPLTQKLHKYQLSQESGLLGSRVYMWKRGIAQLICHLRTRSRSRVSLTSWLFNFHRKQYDTGIAPEAVWTFQRRRNSLVPDRKQTLDWQACNKVTTPTTTHWIQPGSV